MDSRQLAYVVALAEEGSFTAAAARCHIVQSALSHTIAALERELGVALFERTSRGAHLTAAGAALLPHARAVGAELASAREVVAELAGAVTGELRLGMFGAALHVRGVADALAAFHLAHPRVVLLVGEPPAPDMVAQVRAGQLDLAFVGLFADQLGDGVLARELDVSRLVAVVGTSSRLAAAPPTTLAELAAATPLVETPAGTSLRVAVDHVFRTAGVTRRTRVELPDVEDVVRFAAMGLGAALVREPFARTLAAQHPVVLLRLADECARVPVTLVHRAPSPRSPAARAFLAQLELAMAQKGRSQAGD